jgi:hypothetical protein
VPRCGPGPFSMANADTVTDVLTHAGYEDIRLARQDLPYKIGDDLEHAVAFNMALGPAAEVLRLWGRARGRRQAEDRRRPTRCARGLRRRRRRRRRPIIDLGRDRASAAVAQPAPTSWFAGSPRQQRTRGAPSGGEWTVPIARIDHGRLPHSHEDAEVGRVACRTAGARPDRASPGAGADARIPAKRKMTNSESQPTVYGRWPLGLPTASGIAAQTPPFRRVPGLRTDKAFDTVLLGRVAPGTVGVAPSWLRFDPRSRRQTFVIQPGSGRNNKRVGSPTRPPPPVPRSPASASCPWGPWAARRWSRSPAGTCRRRPGL